MTTLPPADSDLARDASVLETQAAYRAWPETRVLRVRGDDRVSWLNGQLTNDVRNLATHTSAHALAVNVRGKIMAEVWVTDLGDQLLVLVPERAQATLLESFEHFIIMEDVTLEPAPELQVLSLEGPLASALQSEVTAAHSCRFACDPLGLGGVVWLGSAEQLAAVSGQLEAHAPRVRPEAYELVRVRHARPRYGVDFDEHQYPQEAGLKAYVSFNKGCYLGQEVVCTLENRGRLSRHLCALQGAPGQRFEPGATLSLATNPAEAVGTLTSCAWDPTLGASLALGYVRRVHAKPAAQLSSGTQALTLMRVVGEDASGTDGPASA